MAPTFKRPSGGVDCAALAFSSTELEFQALQAQGTWQVQNDFCTGVALICPCGTPKTENREPGTPEV